MAEDWSGYLVGDLRWLDLTDPPTPEEVWSTVVTNFINPLINVVEAVAEALLTAPLNAANLFGRIALGQFGSGVPIMALTTAVPNELEPFTAASVPTSDGWSFNASEDAAQVVCDGSPKTLYLKSGVIKVEAGQPINTTVPVKYSGVVSGAGQTIRYVLETFTSDNGSGAATPVTVGAVTNPSGTITSPVTLGDTSWDIPAGVQSVRPALVVDGVTAGTVFWKNTPTLKRILAGPLAGGLPAAIQDRIDEFQQLLTDLLTNPAGVIGTITQGMVSGLGDLNTLVNQIRDILAGLVVTPINSTVAAIKDWFAGLTGKTSGLNSSGQMNGTNIIGTIASNVVEGLDDIGDGLRDTWNHFWDGIFRTTGSTGKTAADVQTAAASVSTTAAIAQESTATLANLMNAPKNVPFWVSPNPFEDVVFPRVMASEAKIFTGGRLYLTALRTTQNRIYNQVGFMTNGGDPQENVFVAVYRIDPANGTYTLEYNFGNVSSQILTGSGLVDQRFNMPYDLQASEGDLWAVGILTTGTGSYPGLVCVASSAMDYTGLHPRCATAVLASQTSIPSSVSAASVTRAADRVWASLGQALDFVPPSIQLAEQFSTGQWSSAAWYLFGSGDYDAQTGVIAADGGLHMRVQPGFTLPVPKKINRSSGIHKTAMTTNDMASEVTIARVPDTSVPPIWAIVRASNNSTLGAALEITTNQARIITFDAPADPTPTARATASTTVSVGDVFRIEAVGTVYTAYRNGVPIPGCTWTDTGNAVIPLVASLRRTGWLVSFNAGFSSQDHSAWIATWRGYDLA
ncbi:hypothetical protein BN970_03293 [Mycolicibacterium conceptionense]|uniref:Minor tail protein n=1 Tax=Mycolicibacterium conceptionense TaxID=451644 RepID=A0A0U1DFZ9_9MYCO|nr:hypothetical protein BN970_03293 [Mycolicibacterium conceptionense]